MERLKMPLSRTLLDDPAFSPDPRSHPHFPLTHAHSYKALPSKSPPRLSHTPLRTDGPPSRSSPSSPSPSSDSDSFASASPTTSSATSHSQSPSRGSPVPSPVLLLPVPPLSTKPKVVSKPPPPQRPLPLPVPEILPKPDSTNTLASQVLKPVQNSIPRKARMKAFVRRLTTRHDLDRIDELDETDPFGGSYHHDGPYEAIGSNLAQPTLPLIFSNAAPRRTNIHRSKRESDPHPLRPGQYQPASRVPSAYGETGLSLHLEPGQILQQNAIYSSHASTIAAVPGQFRPQPNTVSITTRPDHSRRQSLPNPRTRSAQDPSSLDFPVGFQNHQSSSLRAPRERYLGNYTPEVPNSPPFHHDHDAAPYVLHQIEKTVFPPPRYESRLHNSGPPRSSQRTPLPSFNPTSPKTQSTESAVPALPRRDSRHKSVHSLDSSYITINSTFTQCSSSIQNKPLDPLRIRHLSKRLVMPTPLQPQPPQPQYNFPPAEPPTWQDEYDHALEGAHFEGKPAMYSQEPRLLRKKSSAFAAKTPIPDHVPTSQDDAVPIMGNYRTKTANEAEGTKERTRRRRLSKRKNDI